MFLMLKVEELAKDLGSKNAYSSDILEKSTYYCPVFPTNIT